MYIPVILSGGSGSRLWPLSRTLRPKQFLALTGDLSLFQLTLERLAPGEPGALAPILVANDEHRFLAADQCRELGVTPRALILEPVARNTAPAIVAAALAAGDGDDPVLLVLPSDHVIENNVAFRAALEQGEAAARAGAIVTFGIVPTHPETGYGYVKAGAGSFGKVAGAHPVEAFVEKPDAATAQSYLDAGNYYWNSGMFMFRVSVLLAELERHAPDILAFCREAVAGARTDLDFMRLKAEAFARNPSVSIDYALMEKTEKAALVPLNAGWSDVGAWSAIWQVQPRDAQGNASRGDVLLQDARNCYVHADYRLTTLLGVDDLVVIETSDAVLVARKDRAQDVKLLIDQLKAGGRSEVHVHREVFRPWGSYDSIDFGSRYQVKRITVNPGAKLSLQMHHHRAEHWVVVSGTARVRIGEVEKLVPENESVYIPIGTKHSLENPGKVPLELIEVQSGSYLGEDDIVRFEDRYGRA